MRSGKAAIRLRGNMAVRYAVSLGDTVTIVSHDYDGNGAAVYSQQWLSDMPLKNGRMSSRSFSEVFPLSSLKTIFLFI
jgi:hypothetical protein